MTTEQIVIGLLILFGLIIGYVIARRTEEKSPIHGGTMAWLCNYVASALIVSLPLTVILSIFVLDMRAAQVIIMAIGLITLAFIVLVVYAMFEKPHVKQALQEDRGWTEEDARSSGL
jgi:uncharacterized protein YneF (UPF0154 family)